MFTHLNRSVFLSGTLSPPIIVNSSDVLKTTQYSVQMNQDINIDHLFIQGGPGKSIAEMKKKVISGGISFIPRINESNTLEKSFIDLINSSQNYNSFITLSTFLLPYNAGITADDSPYISSTQSLVYDTCLIESLSITAKADSPVEVDLKIQGQCDFDNVVPLVLPPDTTELYRKINWYDCFFQRNGSQMENVTEVEIKIIKGIDQKYFLMIYNDPQRYDRPYSTGVTSVEVQFKIVEEITSIFDIFTYSFGGFDENINFSGNFGPISFLIPNSVLKVSVQNLPSGKISRTTEGFYRMNPRTPNTNNFLLTI